MFIRRKKYDAMAYPLQQIYHAITSTDPREAYMMLDVENGDVKSEAGMVIGIANPNYTLIKELLERGLN